MQLDKKNNSYVKSPRLIDRESFVAIARDDAVGQRSVLIIRRLKETVSTQN